MMKESNAVVIHSPIFRSFTRFARFARCLLGSWIISSPALHAEPVTEIAVELQRIPPTMADAALATFQMRPGFRIEQVAQEPLVADPVAIAFDERGRLFVAEMRGYSERRDENLGRIRLLTDSDGDGRFDESSIYADGLRWPTGLICWRGGVFVITSPDLLYISDTDDDDRADRSEVIFTGFGAGTAKLNVQALPNSLVWGPDNRIHGATANNGGSLIRPGSDSTAINLNGRDFSFDPIRLDLRAENGGGQYGMAFDAVGRKFVCSNSNHLQWIPFAAKFNTPQLTGRPVDIAIDGPSAEVFRTSPDEPWRIVRTRWRMAGEVPGPVEGGGRPSGYFTAATGVTLFRGDAFPASFTDNAFVCDAGSNLVHRKIIEPSAGHNLLEARRAADEQDIEFLTSTDNWFRPVQATNGPDGALYIVDMYREVIEHPWSLPAPLKSQLDLNSGNDRGRIYRIVPDDFKPPQLPAVHRASPVDLVKWLEHPNGWYRDTVSRLLLEQGEQSLSAVPALRQTLSESRSANGRLAALQMLTSLGKLDEQQLNQALHDQHPHVRQRAVVIATALRSPAIEKSLLSLASDSDAEVSFHATLALIRMETSPEIRESLKAAIETHPNHPWCRKAALAGLEKAPLESLHSMLASPQLLGIPQTFDVFTSLLRKVPKPLPPATSEKLNQLVKQIDNPLSRAALLSHSGIGMPESEQQLLAAALESIAKDPSASQEDRKLAIHHLPKILGDNSLNTLAEFLTPSQSPAIQQAAVTAIRDSGLPQGGKIIVDHWPRLAAHLQRHALNQLFQRPEWRDSLLDGLEEKTVALTLLQSQQIESLRNVGSDAQKERARRLLISSIVPEKTTTIAAFALALELVGNPVSGRDIFSARCASCHRKGKLGERFGPDVATFQNAGGPTILNHIMDPDREIQPRYTTVSITTSSGALHIGYVASENETTVTLREVVTGDRVMQRTSITKMERFITSPMPKGLEAGLSQQQMADLLAFISATASDQL
ncbi:MAG: putative membrane-bound dehydrogenase-like protein [Verrucomicrobiales bacterium]|jgi:putative membrane-bound dehydrogenase-like protein